MNAETAVNETETTASPNEQQVATQETVKEQTLTQDDVNRIVAERVARERAKFEKKYSNVDLDHYNNLVGQEEARKQEELEKRGEYEKLLKDQAEKFSGKIQQYETELHSIKIDGALLNEAGAVDVVDANGQVRYDDKGEPIKVSSLVNEFLTANPHFVSAGPSGSGTGQGVGKQTPVVENDVTKLDMNNPTHREQYRKIMNERGVRI